MFLYRNRKLKGAVRMFLVLSVSITLLFALGLAERKRHQKNVEAIPVRVNINGIRGKSTVTRLVTGVLLEAGHETIGKTTGTEASMLYWAEGKEEPIQRRPEGPNIREQKDVVKSTAEYGATALVSECMAVTPDYQEVFQNNMLQANISLIVNVLEDHMEVLGPTLDEVADSFTSSIPYNGSLIVNESPYVPYFKEIAEERNTDVFVCDTSRISEDFLRQFEYMVFPENAALALAVADVLDIDEETAKRGMLKAWADPGAMKVLPMGNPEIPSFFVNGFAANDATSTINIWERVKNLSYPTDMPVFIMNCREDRVDRTEQFAKDVLPHMEMDTLVVIGETISPIIDAYNQGYIRADRLINLERTSTDEIIEALKPYMYENRTIYGMGNIHGAAEPLVERFQEFKTEKELGKVENT